jgi:copper chaperone CopZ
MGIDMGTNTKLLTVTIEGMHCGGCVRRVTNALTSVQGTTVETVEVGSAKVSYDAGAVSPEQIIAAVNRIGFKAEAQQEK